MSGTPQQRGNETGTAHSAAVSDTHSFRLLLWVCCGIIDLALVAGLVWWLVD